MQETIYHTFSAEETEALGEALAQTLARAPAVALYGDLGMGKTAFVRGLARGLGSRAQVSSPTFAIVNEYEGPRRICHFDFYRLPDADALFDIGWEDYLASGSLCVAEWSENATDAFPEGTAEVVIRRLDDADGREITVRLC